MGRSYTLEDDLPLYSVSSKCIKLITVDIETNDTKVCMKVATGAAVSLMFQEVKEKLFPESILQQSITYLRIYTGEAMKVMSKLPVTATYGDQSKKLTLYIVPEGPTYLGGNGC